MADDKEDEQDETPNGIVWINLSIIHSPSLVCACAGWSCPGNILYMFTTRRYTGPGEEMNGRRRSFLLQLTLVLELSVQCPSVSLELFLLKIDNAPPCPSSTFAGSFVRSLNMSITFVLLQSGIHRKPVGCLEFHDICSTKLQKHATKRQATPGAVPAPPSLAH